MSSDDEQHPLPENPGAGWGMPPVAMKPIAGENWTLFANIISSDLATACLDTELRARTATADVQRLDLADIHLFGENLDRPSDLALCEFCNHVMVPEAIARHAELVHGQTFQVTNDDSIVPRMVSTAGFRSHSVNPPDNEDDADLLLAFNAQLNLPQSHDSNASRSLMLEDPMHIENPSPSLPSSSSSSPSEARTLIGTTATSSSRDDGLVGVSSHDQSASGYTMNANSSSSTSNSPISGSRSSASASASTSASNAAGTGHSNRRNKKVLPVKDREYDPEAHCGVNLDGTGPCTRSLTCKTHQVSLRRAVDGRSKPFDDLLAERRTVGRDPSQKHSSSRKQTLHSTGENSNQTIESLGDSNSSSSYDMDRRNVPKKGGQRDNLESSSDNSSLFAIDDAPVIHSKKSSSASGGRRKTTASSFTPSPDNRSTSDSYVTATSSILQSPAHLHNFDSSVFNLSIASSNLTDMDTLNNISHLSAYLRDDNGESLDMSFWERIQSGSHDLSVLNQSTETPKVAKRKGDRSERGDKHDKSDKTHDRSSSKKSQRRQHRRSESETHLSAAYSDPSDRKRKRAHDKDKDRDPYREKHSIDSPAYLLSKARKASSGSKPTTIRPSTAEPMEPMCIEDNDDPECDIVSYTDGVDSRLDSDHEHVSALWQPNNVINETTSDGPAKVSEWNMYGAYRLDNQSEEVIFINDKGEIEATDLNANVAGHVAYQCIDGKMYLIIRTDANFADDIEIESESEVEDDPEPESTKRGEPASAQHRGNGEGTAESEIDMDHKNINDLNIYIDDDGNMMFASVNGLFMPRSTRVLLGSRGLQVPIPIDTNHFNMGRRFGACHFRHTIDITGRVMMQAFQSFQLQNDGTAVSANDLDVMANGLVTYKNREGKKQFVKAIGNAGDVKMDATQISALAASNVAVNAAMHGQPMYPVAMPESGATNAAGAANPPSELFDNDILDNCDNTKRPVYLANKQGNKHLMLINPTQIGGMIRYDKVFSLIRLPNDEQLHLLPNPNPINSINEYTIVPIHHLVRNTSIQFNVPEAITEEQLKLGVEHLLSPYEPDFIDSMFISAMHNALLAVQEICTINGGNQNGMDAEASINISTVAAISQNGHVETSASSMAQPNKIR